MDTLLHWLLGAGSHALLALCFLLAAGIVVGAGLKLGAFGNALAERTGLGSGLIGLIFLAGVTSLPELVVSTTSTLAASLEALTLPLASPGAADLLRGGADLAVGNMVGSNVFNLMIFALMDLTQGKGALLFRLSRRHTVSAACGVGLLGVVLFGFAFGRDVAWTVPLLDVGPITPILFIGYVGTMYFMMHVEKMDFGDVDEMIGHETEERLVTMPAARFYGTLLTLALLIVLGGMWLSQIGDRIALPWDRGGFGLGQSFVGTIFLAIATSLPEMVVSYGAVRIRAYDMAAGNILGSNIFNLVILFTADLGLRGGSLLHYASEAHYITIAMVMMLTCVVIVGIMFQTRRSFARIGYDVWLMVLVYFLGNAALLIQSMSTS